MGIPRNLIETHGDTDRDLNRPETDDETLGVGVAVMRGRRHR